MNRDRRQINNKSIFFYFFVGKNNKTQLLFFNSLVLTFYAQNKLVFQVTLNSCLESRKCKNSVLLVLYVLPIGLGCMDI